MSKNKNTIITPARLGKCFALDSNLTRIEFCVAGKAMTFAKKAGKYIISFEGSKTITSDHRRVIRLISETSNFSDPVCYNQHSEIAKIRLVRFAPK